MYVSELYIPGVISVVKDYSHGGFRIMDDYGYPVEVNFNQLVVALQGCH